MEIVKKARDRTQFVQTVSSLKKTPIPEQFLIPEKIYNIKTNLLLRIGL